MKHTNTMTVSQFASMGGIARAEKLSAKRMSEIGKLGAASVGSKEFVRRLVDRFLTWPLPESVCADPCATTQGPNRIGTMLLTATEAEQMITHLLEPTISKDASTEEEGESYTQGFFDGVAHAEKSPNEKADSCATK
jgi:hypothetical protein